MKTSFDWKPKFKSILKTTQGRRHEVSASFQTKTHQIQQKKMNSHETLTLIEGTFLPSEAKEILMNIFYEKIKFHQIKDISSLEKNGTHCQQSQIRISKLKEESHRMKDILDKAESEGKKLVISSKILISFSQV
jgi:hypothetical protein